MSGQGTKQQATTNSKSTINSGNFGNVPTSQQQQQQQHNWTMNLSGSSFPIAFSDLPVLTSLTASQEALFTSSSSFDMEEEKNNNSSPFTSSDTALEEDSSSSTPSSPPYVLKSESKSISQILDQVNARFENLLDLPQIYLTDPNGFVGSSNNKLKLQLANISKSKNIMGAYHGTIKPLKFRYPAQLKENWNEIPVYVPREYRHCTNSNTLRCSCKVGEDPPIPSGAFIFSIEFLDLPIPYGPCQHKTSPCNIQDVPLVGLTTFNGACQTAFAQFKSPQNKKKDSWNFKLITRCPVRAPFSIRIRLSNSTYELETEAIRISQKDKRQPKRNKTDSEQPDATPTPTESFKQLDNAIALTAFAEMLNQRLTKDTSLSVTQCLEHFFSYKRFADTLEQSDLQNFRAYFGNPPHDADNLIEMYSFKSFVGHMNSMDAKKIFMSCTNDKMFIVRFSSSGFEKGYFVFENATSAYRLKRVNNQFFTEGGKPCGTLGQFLASAKQTGELVEPFPHLNWMILTQSKYKPEIHI